MLGGVQTVGLLGLLAQLSVTPPTATVAPLESLSFTASGGTKPYAFDLVANPSGASITRDGVYTAGPSDTPDGGDHVRATDQLGRTGSASIVVANPYRPPPLPTGCSSTDEVLVPLLGLLLAPVFTGRSRRGSTPRENRC